MIMPPDYACPVCKQAYTMVHIPRKKTVFPIIGDPYTVIGPEFDISYRCGCVATDPNKSELEQLRDEVKELRRLLEEKLNPPKVTITLRGTTGDVPYEQPKGTGDFNPLGTWYSTCKTNHSVLY
jgi:hypothetical protein